MTQCFFLLCQILKEVGELNKNLRGLEFFHAWLPSAVGVTFVIVLQRQGLGQASKTIFLSPSILCRKQSEVCVQGLIFQEQHYHILSLLMKSFMQQSFKLLFTVATMQLNDIFHQFEVPEAKVQHGDEAHQINDNARGCEKCNVVAYSKDPLFCQLLISLSMVPLGGTQPGGFVPAAKVSVAIKIATVIIVFLALCRASSYISSCLCFLWDGCSSKSSFHTGCALDVGKRPQDSMTHFADMLELDAGTTPGLLAKSEV
ncbi:hypothetical protein Patl1_10421 [Pistacia atlantica]|uniref:Uncharacterized protein n=1 Tax=Pistacia atlantica TaxID=434234 RepID=A0ACC1A550_9ROSI|nr:hypothetical protein Patl1_10421 [Pistacia atlantica]